MNEGSLSMKLLDDYLDFLSLTLTFEIFVVSYLDILLNNLFSKYIYCLLNEEVKNH